MPADQPEVHIKLVIDDQSQATLNKIQENIHHSEDAAKKVTQETSLMGKAAEFAASGYGIALVAALAVGAVMYEAAKSAWDLGAAAAHAAEEANKQVKAMSGLMSLMDGGAHKMSEVHTYAKGLREELEEAGLKANTSAADMTEAFNAVIERGGIGTEKAKELTEQMAIVGKIVPQGMQGIAAGFSQFEMGVIRARNPIVQLIASTHTLQGNAHAVAAALQKMAPEKQLEAAYKAVEKQAELMKTGGGAGGPSMGAIKKSMELMRESVLESMGQPIIDHIIPPLNRVRMFLMSHIEEMKAYGERVGVVMGEAIDVIAAVGDRVASVVGKDWAALSGSVSGAAGVLRSAWDYVLLHKNDIADAVAAVAHAVMVVIQAMTAALKHVISSVGSVVDLVRNVGMIGTGHSTKTEAAEGAAKAAAGAMGTNQHAAFEEAVAEYQRVSVAAGTSSEEIRRMTESLKTTEAASAAATAAINDASERGDVTTFSQYLNSAIETHNQGMLDYAIVALSGSEQLQEQLASGAVQIEGGFDDFIRMLNAKAPELADSLKSMANTIAGEGGIKASTGPTVNMSGGQTFNIKQDFRDADPDRVALTFKRDLRQHSLARVQSRMAFSTGL